MVNMLALGTEERWQDPRSGQTKDYQTGICCFSAKHASLMRKGKDWFACNRNNVSVWCDRSFRGPHHHLIEN